MRLSVEFNADDGVNWLVVLFLLAWMGFIAAVLLRKDLEPVERLIWLVTVIFVPFFGMAFYLFIAPENKATKAVQSPDDQTLGSPETGTKVRARSDVSGTPWQNDPGHVA